MGLLSNIIGFPVTGPMKALTFVAKHVKEQADEQMKPIDPQTELLELEMKHEIGKISDSDYEKRVDELLQLLAEQQEELMHGGGQSDQS